MVFQQEIVLEKIDEILDSSVFVTIITEDKKISGLLMIAHFLVPVEKEAYKGIGVKLQATFTTDEEKDIDPKKFFKDRRDSLKKYLKRSFTEKVILINNDQLYPITKVEDVEVLDIRNIVAGMLRGQTVLIEMIPTFIKELKKQIYHIYSQDYTII